MITSLAFPKNFPDDNWINFTYDLEPLIVNDKYINTELILGRDPTSELTVISKLISRKHFSLVYNSHSELWSIQDLKSENGTFLNGKKLKPYNLEPLSIGDKIAFADTYINVVDGADDTIRIDAVGEETIADNKPILLNAPKPIETPDIIQELKDSERPLEDSRSRSKDDSLYLFVSWIIKPDTALGLLYRILLIVVVAYVLIEIFTD